ncbi:endonuclease/exonuclease/phosphatase family protein [Pseudomonas sp. B21-054]|uniref:endonuclease/exonuclease/phosphatase family protein n=1 Tax=Pseudomonas sp. B21-054 TaxID=2895494 RepID=UPI00223259BC|nr:endonuclease/exonuclease/phosphatase family protein [Pseudomonas sp. B21-054]UZE20185.1 endonuclease/exonuclease/phosphatase family protein [Pseudomonas sp. B21-054]
MAKCKILIWNTQHLNNQAGGKMSDAYQEKLATLNLVLQQDTPDIVALFEVGSTGNPNDRLVNDLSQHYTLKASLDQDGGLRKSTTLGSMVFVRTGRDTEFKERYIWPLGPEARRATLLLTDDEGNTFAFCHANASRNAWPQILGDIQELGSIHEGDFQRLVFFGGDLNTPYSSAPKTLSTHRGATRMNAVFPEGSGFTHITIRSTETQARKAYKKLDEVSRFYTPIDQYVSSLLGGDLGYGDFAIPSQLDYAYVHEHVEARGYCDAAVQIKKSWVHDRQLIRSADELKVRGHDEVVRIFRGQALRSDHYPVLYELQY